MRGPLSVVAACLLTTGAFGISAPQKGSGKIPVVAGKYILEATDASGIPGKRSESVHERLYSELNARDISYIVDKEYKTDVFIGASVTLTDPDDIEAIASASGVKNVYPVHIYDRPSPVRFDVVAQDADVDTQSSHIMTGVDKLHAEGITGEGIQVGILDTGIDYTHPALGGGFGPGFKVEGGYDLVGDDYTGYNEPVPDDDPLDQCAGHGTHVAGIIAADPDNAFNISGVAYSSTLTMYRIFGCEGSVTDDIIVDALLLGYDAGLDILSLSLGGADGWTESASSVVASNIAATGVIVTISAGNSGASGSWYTSSPGNGINVISVSSVDNIAIALQNATVGGEVEHDPITYYETFPFNVTEALPIYATSNDTTVVDDACEALPDDTPDLSPYLVIVRRGTCTFVEKLANIAEKGAQIAFIYDNGNGFAGIEVGDYNASLIQAADGEWLVEQFAAGVEVTISFPQTGGNYEFPDPEGGLVSSFTSYGPSNDFYFKPAVAAPGGNILSTLPTTQGSYGILSGTSMAAPFVAGVSALLFSVKGTSVDVGTTARTVFESTAHKVPVDNSGEDVWQTLTQQGAGLIDAYAAIHGTTLVSQGELILNDTAHFVAEHTFTVSNTGDSSQDYTLSHIPAGTALTIKEDGLFAALGPVPLSTDAAEVSFSTSSFTLGAGESQELTATFSPLPEDSTLYPVYSGFLELADSNGELTHVSYLGLGASLIEKQVLDTTDYLFGFELPAVLDADGAVQTEPTNYTFEGGDWPAVIVSLLFGTPDFKVDLVDSNTTLDGPFESVGSVVEYVYLSRNDEIESPYYEIDLAEPVFEDGTTIPDGLYKFLVRALRVTGDPESDADYDAWLSPIVGVTTA